MCQSLSIGLFLADRLTHCPRVDLQVYIFNIWLIIPLLAW